MLKDASLFCPNRQGATTLSIATLKVAPFSIKCLFATLSMCEMTLSITTIRIKCHYPWQGSLTEGKA
jgi:hypothetical protein